MNDQLDTEIKTVFDDIVARTPELGPVPDSHLIPATLSPQRGPSRWLLPAAAALAIFAIGAVVLILGNRDGTETTPSATAPQVATETLDTVTPPTGDTQVPPTSVMTPSTTNPAEPATTPTEPQPATTPPPDTSPATPPPAPAPTATTLPTPTTPPSPPSAASKTVLAFSADGKAFQVPVGQSAASPLFAFDALNDFWEMFDVSFTHNVAFIGTCCEPGTGQVYQIDNLTTIGEQPSGYGVAISPNENLVAIGSFVDNPIVIKDLRSGTWVDSPPSPGWENNSVGSFTPFDVLWLDNQHLVVLGSLLSGDAATNVLYGVTLDEAGHITAVSDRVDTGRVTDTDTPMFFAGRPDQAHFALHQKGSSEVLLFDSNTKQQTGTQSAGERGYASVWYDETGQLTTVDSDGVLRIDNTVISGTYAWARTT